ncbi:hypothetical protein KY306_02000 [Candidatus Woesearchaeota archaeon]|nr:hypothetical protein [Candidatus Woesearchaeota archaeon]
MNLNWNEIYGVLKPLILFVIGMVLYAVFIFKFYRFLGRKDIFKLNLKEKYGVQKFFGGIWYVIEHLLLFPIAVFLWFAIVSVLLMILAKNQTTSGILLISMALVATIRITAYYHEDLSKDLAKMLPFALLGVFLIDISFFSWSASWELVKGIPGMWMTVIYYLLFIIALELVLRVVSFFIPKRKEGEKKKK